jgi:hypothetical protein
LLNGQALFVAPDGLCANVSHTSPAILIVAGCDVEGDAPITDSMLKDIHFRFPGFHGSAGRCHIRLARADRRSPLVVVCSQYTNYQGTSVTNALEIIAATLFDQIARGEISGVSLDEPLPWQSEWHSDVQWFDKVLARVFPEKYENRFLTTYVDASKAFSKVVWIENYPVELTSSLFPFKHLSAVTLDESGSPVWHHRITSEWLVEKTGFSIDALLPLDESLDLRAIESGIEIIPHTTQELWSVPGYHHVRWTKELLDFLPGLLSSARAYRGRSGEADLDEYAVHDEVEKFLAVSLPARELFKREFKFSKLLNIYRGGKEKAVDFALYSPEGESVDSLLEVKRTSAQSNDLRAEVTKDIARLLLLSSQICRSCYLLVCGATEIIDRELAAMGMCLSLADEDDSRDRQFKTSDIRIDSEYAGLLQQFDVNHGFSKLQGITSAGPNRAVLWQIAAQHADLRMHRPYEFSLTKARRG